MMLIKKDKVLSFYKWQFYKKGGGVAGAGVYIILFAPPPHPGKYGQISFWGGNMIKGWRKKGGKCILFPQFVTSIP